MSASKNDSFGNWSAQPVIDWLFGTGCMMNDNSRFVRELGHQLIACGAPLDMFRVVMRTLHPEMVGASYTWQKSTDTISHSRTEHRIRHTDKFIGSPLQQLLQTEQIVRQRLDHLPDDAHRAYTELSEAGYVDYLALPVMTAAGFNSALIIVTERSEGFSDADIEKFSLIRDYLVPVIEVQSLRELTISLLNTYVGKRTGEKVLAGMIRRGDADIINAALWFSDLRNFTQITESLAAEQVLGMLNDYFEFVAAAVTARYCALSAMRC